MEALSLTDTIKRLPTLNDEKQRHAEAGKALRKEFVTVQESVCHQRHEVAELQDPEMVSVDPLNHILELGLQRVLAQDPHDLSDDTAVENAFQAVSTRSF